MVDNRSEVLYENYESLVRSPSISDDGEIVIYINPDLTDEKQKEIIYVAVFVLEDIQRHVYEKMESIFADDSEIGINASNISIDLKKVQQAQVCYNVINDTVINDSSDYTIQSESNVKLEQGIELLTYTPVSDMNYHSSCRLLDKVKDELRAMIDIFFGVTL